MKQFRGLNKLLDRTGVMLVFRPAGRWDWPVIVVFVLINGLVLLNAIVHASYRGYDSIAFMINIDILSQGQLPYPSRTPQFFSPPLPFVIPALARHYLDLSIHSAAKIGQWVQFLLSIGVTFYLLKMCRQVGFKKSATFCTLLFLGLLPVYYRTFAMVRGEPWVLFFLILAMNQMVAIFLNQQAKTWRIVLLGIFLGLGLLSRQWAIFFVPVLFGVGGIAFVKRPRWRWLAFKSVSLSLLVAFVMSSWFYFHLKAEYGKFSAFNRQPAESFSLRNQPASFYFDLSFKELMTHPQRPSFSNRFWPVMYADAFGDYWGYFSVYVYEFKKDYYWPMFWLIRNGGEEKLRYIVKTNLSSISPYLGRVARVSLFPAVIFIAGFIYVLIHLCRPHGLFDWHQPLGQFLLMYLLLALVTMLGYGWFLIMYPNLKKGDTIKPTYILQVFPFFAMCAGCLMGQIQEKWPRLYKGLLVILAMVAIHNLPVMVSHAGMLRPFFDWLHGV